MLASFLKDRDFNARKCNVTGCKWSWTSKRFILFFAGEKLNVFLSRMLRDFDLMLG